MAKNRHFFEKKNSFEKNSTKSPKIDVFLARFVGFGQKRVFQSILKIPELGQKGYFCEGFSIETFTLNSRCGGWLAGWVYVHAWHFSTAGPRAQIFETGVPGDICN